MSRVACTSVLLLALGACAGDAADDSGAGGGGGGKADDLGATGSVALAFDFTDGDDHGWSAIFRDLPADILAEYERRVAAGEDLGPVAPLTEDLVDIPADSTHWLLHAGLLPLPDGLAGSGFLLQGTNRSDDLDKYLVLPLDADDGIEPDASYRVTFERVAFAADAPLGLFGVGGDPALDIDGVVSSIDPTHTFTDDSSHVRHPKGVFTAGHATLATTAVCIVDGAPEGPRPPSPPPPLPFALTASPEPRSLTATATSDGHLYLMVGGHSGFEGFSAIYMTEIAVLIERL